MGHRVAVYLVLARGGSVLFGRRSNTGYRDGEYGLPSGKVEPGELLVDAVVREAREEIAVALEPEAVSLVHLAERRTPTGDWLDFYFTAPAWRGDPVNAEPDKCAGLDWLAPDDPSVIDYIRDALGAIAGDRPFSQHVGD